MSKKINLHKKYMPLITSDKRFTLITGGRGAGKSYGVCTFLVFLMMEVGHTILFTRYTKSSTGLSIIPEFVDKIEHLGLEHLFDITADYIQHKATKSIVIFKGLKTSSGDQSANLKSLHGATTWVLEEAEELTDEKIFNMIDLSIRSSAQQNRVIMLMNPTTKEHWIYKRFFEETGIEPGSNCQYGDTNYIHTTYLDIKKHLPESFVKKLDDIAVHSPLRYEHEVIGSWLDKAEGVIFPNWTHGEFDDSLICYYGCDWGYNDPTTLIKVAIDKKNKILYLDECLYTSHLTPTETIDIFTRTVGKTLVIADCAYPATILDIKRRGINIIGYKKGPGTKLSGINLMTDYKIVVTQRSKNIVKELNAYRWIASDTPVDAFDHALDAVRYVVLEITQRSRTSLAKRF